MSLYSPKEIASVVVNTGIAKSRLPVPSLLILGFLAGVFIATGFLLDIHVINQLPQGWGSFNVLIGAAVFPVGIILTVLAGGELLTGNMMVMPVTWFARKIKVANVLHNLFWVTLANFAGSIAVAWFFGHLLGMTEGDYLKKALRSLMQKSTLTFYMPLFRLLAVTGWFVWQPGPLLVVKISREKFWECGFR